jgi:hypothetical protein
LTKLNDKAHHADAMTVIVIIHDTLYAGYAEMVLMSLERREILREAVFLCMTPFLAALSIFDFAVSSFFSPASFDNPLASSRTSLTIFFTLVFTDLLRRRLSSFCRARLSADL